ncbi:MAG TPA: GGDEF domain-containing protein [Actinomycetota bacterium]|nr:GGDEF domain-containing protein [Actinomycetota bacterium]
MSESTQPAHRASSARASLGWDEGLGSVRDPLTGLFGPGYLEETLEREVSRVGRAAQPLSVLAVAVDQEGPDPERGGSAEALRRVAELLAANVRAEDVACRYGGRFVLVLPGAPWDVSRQRAEAIREAVKRLPPGSLGPWPATASVGLATFPENGSTGLELLAAALHALEQARAEGGDRVRTAAG